MEIEAETLARIMNPPSNPESLAQAESVLLELARVFVPGLEQKPEIQRDGLPNAETRYRTLLDQIPAVVFMAYLDEGVGEAYVSPQIEKSLGFSQREWLEDPVRWYQQIHPEDKDRWSVEAAQMFLSGEPLRSAYRVLSRDGRTVWFHCEAKMIRYPDGRPWFIHGVGFDITDLKRTEAALAEQRDVLSTILDTVGALVAVLDSDGRIVQFNRACEQATGYRFEEVSGTRFHDRFLAGGEAERFASVLVQLSRGARAGDYEGHLTRRSGEQRLIHWSITVLPRGTVLPPATTLPRATRGVPDGTALVIATGIDITEQKRLEQAVLEVSNSEQRRIGQDLHDGLGQHLTGIAFMSKVLEQKLADQSLPEAADAAKIVKLVNDGIHKTRVLARGLLPGVSSEPLGLMSALQHWASEVEDLFQVSCRFECEEPVLISNDAAVNHLYRIVQEAVHNAIRHGKAKNIGIGLIALGGRGTLTIQDDGSGIREPKQDTQRPGMGLSIMRYRAGMIGGLLEITRSEPGGTLVTCEFPL